MPGLRSWDSCRSEATPSLSPITFKDAVGTGLLKWGEKPEREIRG